MIAEQFKAFATQQPDAPAILAGPNCYSYTALAHRIEQLEAQHSILAGQTVGVWIDDVIQLIATAAALDALGTSLVLFSGTMSRQQVEQTSRTLNLQCVLTDKSNTGGSGFIQLSDAPPTAPPSGGHSTSSATADPVGQVILFTSGTSGAPKPAINTWSRLAAGINQSPRYHGRRWLLAYDSTRFAGIQVWLQALLTGGCLCVPASRDPADVAKALIDQRVEFASATPSFWRLLLSTVSTEQLAAASLVQITLGGEAVDQAILDRLRLAFPKARITHIYASTEMGVCFSVNDGLAGFPATFLNDPNLPCDLRIGEDGELEIRSRRAMLGYLERQTSTKASANAAENRPTSDWFPTGDLVEQRADRVFFVGRKSETINVGGQKVYPADVEQCIGGVPGVQQVRVSGMPSSLTGQLVKAEVEPVLGVDRETLRREILAACRGRLARHQSPASIEFVDHLPLSQSGKLSRSETQHAQ